MNPSESTKAQQPAEDAGAQLAAFLQRHPGLVVLTGAGVSTASGIPDYRDLKGQWKRPQPVTYQAFMGAEHTRQRYWARSLVGWRTFGQARPGAAHHALAQLEEAGWIDLLITQNVDGLHEAAGSRAVVDLHGRLDTVRCMECERRFSRAQWQDALVDANPGWAQRTALSAPDGDADLEAVDFSDFVIPPCPHCGSRLLKPDVVFYGESVPRERVERSLRAVQRARGVLVLGSSLIVYSGYRFVLAAEEAGIPVAAVNRGTTRGDTAFVLKLDADVGETLRAAASILQG
ncbi:NAD-dependent protein deacetylase [Diaphorobacter sp. HDW4A]|uniref:NAD-dependent protein deacetylase n=1 Tax=Diaphorobacter sp. HDW4A TaxID=2714924 RepID=UPI00140732BD|nr:NAD-dependent protein deacetylase [Diaphorobacter sp. HDW4A]QIL79807.1 NAD-dependent protein deacetylase [Diaphorobacter sp. HDW4A]